jgi:hypothetical protein
MVPITAETDLSTTSSARYRHPVVSEQRDGKAAFFVVFLVILTCVQGVRVSDVPVPFALFFSIFYVFVFRPPIPSAAPRIYAFILSYLLVVSTRNALSDTGSVRDFLYIGVCFTNMVITIALFDLFQAMGARKIGMALVVIALFEVSLQLLENLDAGGFNSVMAPALRFWAAQTNSEAFLTPAALAERTAGTFGASTGAGLALYLVIRGAAVVLRRRGLIYLSIIPIVMGGARSALIIFLTWEIFVQSLFYWRRNFALTVTGFLLLFSGLLAPLIFPHLLAKVFLFRSFNVQPAQFAEGFSVVNRLRSIEWALQHWQEFATFGGVTSTEMANRISWQGSGVDSEFILRSMQFGFTGFLCLLVSNIWTGFFWKNPDSWFVLFFAMISSLTNSMLSNYVLFPFVIIYCLCVNMDQLEPPRAGEAADSPGDSRSS